MSRYEDQKKARAAQRARQAEILGFDFKESQPLKGFREPMLSKKIEDKDISRVLPTMLSTKIDGIRFTDHGAQTGVLSRSMKRIPNQFAQRVANEIRDAIGDDNMKGLDGEGVIGPPNAPDTYNRSMGLMAADTTPDFHWHVFDQYDLWKMRTGNLSRPYEGAPYHERYEKVKELVARASHPRLVLVEHRMCNLIEYFYQFEEWCLENGYEGMMCNNPTSPYVCTTRRINILGRRKPFVDFEATIIALYEQMENTNEAKTDERGRSKRSSEQSGKIGKNTLGGFTLRSADGVTFDCGGGPGLTAVKRQYIWDNPDAYIGQLAKLRKQKVGELNKPRIPQFIGLRSELDLSPKPPARYNRA